MNSLTAFKKIMEKYSETNTLEGTYDYFLAIKKDLEKLDQLKKIEEELGIDLITLFKATTLGVWVKDEVGQIYHTNVYLHNLALIHSSVENGFCFITPNNELLSFSRIKQDWALTKEELENGTYNNR